MIEEMFEYLKEFATSPSVVVFGAITLVQISPIKLDPWKWILRKIGDALNGDIQKDLAELKMDFEQTKAQDKRWRILDFANSCRNGRRHTREEWKHVISELKEYEEYTKRKNIANGVIEEEAKYLRELYHERNIKNDFL